MGRPAPRFVGAPAVVIVDLRSLFRIGGAITPIIGPGCCGACVMELWMHSDVLLQCPSFPMAPRESAGCAPTKMMLLVPMLTIASVLHLNERTEALPQG